MSFCNCFVCCSSASDTPKKASGGKWGKFSSQIFESLAVEIHRKNAPMAVCAVQEARIRGKAAIRRPQLFVKFTWDRVSNLGNKWRKHTGRYVKTAKNNFLLPLHSYKNLFPFLSLSKFIIMENFGEVKPFLFILRKLWKKFVVPHSRSPRSSFGRILRRRSVGCAEKKMQKSPNERSRFRENVQSAFAFSKNHEKCLTILW